MYLEKDRECPDFHLIDKEYNTYGIEITQSMNENIQRTLSMYKNEFIYINNFHNSDKKYTSNKITKIYKDVNNTFNTGYYSGLEFEDTIIKDIKNTITKKVGKFKNYTKFDNNFLLIQDEQAMEPINLKYIVKSLNSFIVNIDIGFDNIFLIIMNRIYSFNGKTILLLNTI